MPLGGLGTAGVIALGTTLAQAGIGLAQYRKGKQLAKRTVRPTYSMPESMKKNLAMAEANANVGMNAASKQIAMQGIDRGTAAVLNAGSSRRAGLAGLAGVVTSNNDAFSNLAAMDEMARLRNQQNLYNVRDTASGYEDKEWQLNKFDPYADKVAAAQADQGAGMRNIGGALNTAAMIGMAGMGDGTGDGTGDSYKTKNYNSSSYKRNKNFKNFRNMDNSDYIPNSNNLNYG